MSETTGTTPVAGTHGGGLNGRVMTAGEEHEAMFPHAAERLA